MSNVTTFTGQYRSATYESLLHTLSSTGLTSSLQYVYDGDGNASTLQMSVNGLSITNPTVIGTVVFNTPSQVRTALSLGTAALNNAGDFCQVANNLSDVTNITAYNNLSPTTTKGDITYFDGTNNVRLGIGSTGNVITVAGGIPSYAAPTTSGTITSGASENGTGVIFDSANSTSAQLKFNGISAGSTKVAIAGGGSNAAVTVDVNQSNLSIANTQVTGVTLTSGTLAGSISGTSSGTNTGDQVAITSGASENGTGVIFDSSNSTSTQLKFNGISAGSTKVAIAGGGSNAAVTVDVNQSNLSIANTQVTGVTLTSGTLAGSISGTSSGTNTGDQTITLSGNVTGSGTSGITTTIAANAVVYSMIQKMATVTLLGNATGGSAIPEEITLGTNLSFSGTVLNASGGTGITTGKAVAIALIFGS